MDQQQNGSIEPKIPLKKILAIYFKAGKKRALSMLTIGSIFFLIFSTIILVSFSLYQDSFYTYIETDRDWLNDNKISVISDGAIEYPEILTSNFLMKGIDEVESKLDEIMPNVLKSSTGVLEITLNNFIFYNKYNEICLSTFDDISLKQVKNNVLLGRLPENKTEILYYDALNQSLFGVGDILNLTGRIIYNDYPIITHCQIVGIVRDLELVFYNNNLSTDILRRTNNYFITTSNYFSNLINEIDNKNNPLETYIDFNYTFTIQHLRNKKYLRELNDYYWEDKSFVYMPNPDNTHFCEDLLNALNNFKMDWYLQIYKQLLICFPLMLLIGFVSIEIYRTFNYEKRLNYRLLKTHGVDKKTSRKMIFFENLVLLGLSLMIGLSASLIIAYIIVHSLALSSNVSIIYGFLNFTSVIFIIITFIASLLVNFFIDLVQLRKTTITVMEQYKTNKRRFLSKVFSLPELNFLTLGIPLTIFGLLISYICYNGDYDVIIEAVNDFIGFSILAIIGIMCVLLAILLFLRRVMIYLWNRIGYTLWKKRKSFFTLSLKQLSNYIANYKNTIMVFFLIGLCITPGLVMKKSVERHNDLEANLSIGCADIFVKNWDVEGNLEVNVSKIDGVKLTTAVSNIKLDMKDSSVFTDSHYYFNFYVLANITEFVEIVDFTLLNQDGYSKEDVSLLESDLTYMMNRKYAWKNNYNKDEIFTTVGITPGVYQPKNLVYVNDFSYFPLVPKRELEGDLVSDLFHQPTYIDLIVSEQTKDLILEYNARETYQNDYLLIKAVEGANISAIKEELTSKYELTAFTLEDLKSTIGNNLNSLGLTLFIVITILSIVAIVIYGSLKSINIYKERQRLMMIFVQNGARRWFIISSFTLELVLVIFVPIIISIGITAPYLNNFGEFMVNLLTNYKTFKVWFPWWIFIGTGIISLFSVIIGWWTSLSLNIKSYRAYKTE
ncbi:MAG: hypothetical protein JXA54_03940 [Candidatus Heimdallarchaeota archaeon]|nr:hypothetical protein [Candidatus Heimdallarchaeota archaeon]